MNLFLEDATDPRKNAFEFEGLRLHVLPRMAFEACRIRNNHAAISILEPNQRQGAPVPIDPLRTALLELDFAEIPQGRSAEEMLPIYADEYGRSLDPDLVFSSYHAERLIDFLGNQTFDTLVVSCEAGAKRSPAVAACALEFREMNRQAQEVLDNFEGADLHVLQVFRDCLSNRG